MKYLEKYLAIARAKCMESDFKDTRFSFELGDLEYAGVEEEFDMQSGNVVSGVMRSMDGDSNIIFLVDGLVLTFKKKSLR